jgi:tetratricopeptide (TPR) repeat protein
MGTVLSKQGEYGKAMEMYERALRVREKALGADHPDTVRVREAIERCQHGQHGGC